MEQLTSKITGRQFKPEGSSNQKEVQTGRKFKPEGSSSQILAASYVYLTLAAVAKVCKHDFGLLFAGTNIMISGKNKVK